MRLKSSIWVAAYLRRCQTEGIFGAVRKRGAEEAGAVALAPVVSNKDGSARLTARRVLVVDDDDEFRVLIRAQLITELNRLTAVEKL